MHPTELWRAPRYTTEETALARHKEEACHPTARHRLDTFPLSLPRGDGDLLLRPGSGTHSQGGQGCPPWECGLEARTPRRRQSTGGHEARAPRGGWERTKKGGTGRNPCLLLSEPGKEVI